MSIIKFNKSKIVSEATEVRATYVEAVKACTRLGAQILRPCMEVAAECVETATAVADVFRGADQETQAYAEDYLETTEVGKEITQQAERLSQALKEWRVTTESAEITEAFTTLTTMLKEVPTKVLKKLSGVMDTDEWLTLFERLHKEELTPEQEDAFDVLVGADRLLRLNGFIDEELEQRAMH